MQKATKLIQIHHINKKLLFIRKNQLIFYYNMEYLKNIEPSNLSLVRYDVSNAILELVFCNGNLYQYLDVSNETWNQLKAIDFKIRFIKTQIQKKYRHIDILKY